MNNEFNHGKMSEQDLIESLPACVPVYNDETFESQGQVRPEAFIDDRGFLCISSEQGDNFLVIDYYGEFRGYVPYRHPALEAWAEERGGYWEWRDAGSIQFVAD